MKSTKNLSFLMLEKELNKGSLVQILSKNSQILIDTFKSGLDSHFLL